MVILASTAAGLVTFVTGKTLLASTMTVNLTVFADWIRQD